MDFFRSEPYSRYFEHLDRSGGFSYERWGGASTEGRVSRRSPDGSSGLFVLLTLFFSHPTPTRTSLGMNRRSGAFNRGNPVPATATDSLVPRVSPRCFSRLACDKGVADKLPDVQHWLPTRAVPALSARRDRPVRV